MLLDNALTELVIPNWDAAVLGIGALGGVRHLYRKRHPLPAPQWSVEVVPGKNLVDKRESSTYDYRSKEYVNINESIHVRISRSDGEVIKLGSVKATDDHIEDALDELVAKAQDRASSLNARM